MIRQFLSISHEFIKLFLSSRLLTKLSLPELYEKMESRSGKV